MDSTQMWSNEIRRMIIKIRTLVLCYGGTQNDLFHHSVVNFPSQSYLRLVAVDIANFPPPRF